MICTKPKFYKMNVEEDQKLSSLFNNLQETYKLTKPGFNLANGDILYTPAPPMLEQMHHHKLEMTMGELKSQKKIRYY